MILPGDAHGMAPPLLEQPRASVSPGEAPMQASPVPADPPLPPPVWNDRIEQLRNLANVHGIRGPGTPTREEEDPSAMEGNLAVLAAVADSPAAVAVTPAVSGEKRQGIYDLNSQSIAGIAFFVALNCYKDRNLAMVVGLCLEMVLFWDVFSCHRTVGMRSSIRNRILTAPASQQMWGKIQTQAQQMSTERAVGASRLSKVTLPHETAAHGFPTLREILEHTYQEAPFEKPAAASALGVPSGWVLKLRPGGSLLGSEAGDSILGSEAGEHTRGAVGGTDSLTMPPVRNLTTNNRKKGNPMRSAQPGDPSPPRMPTQLPGSKPVAKKRGRPPLVESQARLSGEGLGAKPYAGGEPGVVKKRGRPRSIDKGKVGMKRAKVEGRTGKKVDRPPLAAGSGDFMKLKEREPTVAVVEKVVTSSEFEEESEESEEESATPPPGTKRRQFGVFSPSHLAIGDAVLIRTEQDDDGSQDVEWNKCWSLGRVLKIHVSRKAMDVVWLKPKTHRRISQYPTRQLMGLEWAPWKSPVGGKPNGRLVDWISMGLGMSSIQYGLKLPKDGVFGEEDRDTLAAEVGRLENS